MFCSECGAQLQNGAKFCSRCGASIHPIATQKTPSKSSGMTAIICELCGSNELAKEGGYFVCQHCGTKYSVEEARKLLDGSVIQIDHSNKIDNLLKRGREFENKLERLKAIDYYNQVLDIDSENAEARKAIKNIETHYGLQVNNVFIELVQPKKHVNRRVHIDGMIIGTLNAKYSRIAVRLDVGLHSLTINEGVVDLNDMQQCVHFRIDDPYSRVEIKALSKIMAWPKYEVRYL